MAKQSPLQIVNEKFGSKEKLIKTLSGVLDRGPDESKEELAKRLRNVANAKLLHLHGVADEAKKLGGREKLVKAVAALAGKTKDEDYTTKLGTFSLSKLLDLHASMNRKTAK